MKRQRYPKNFKEQLVKEARRRAASEQTKQKSVNKPTRKVQT